MNNRLRAACAVPHALDLAPSQRFRWEQWAPLLTEHAVDIDFIPFSNQEIDRARKHGNLALAALRTTARIGPWISELRRVGAADVLVVHRNAALLGPPVAELALSRSRTPLVYDFDDAIYSLERESSWMMRNLVRCHWRVGAISRVADLVTVGNRFLADYARQYNDSVEVWPTTVTLDRWTPREHHPPKSKPVVGWTGSSSTVEYLTDLLPVLREVQREEPFRLLVVGGEVDLDGIEGECRPWTSETEISSLQEMDLGLMPLPDNPWTRGKCAFKAIQYHGVGIPAVVSDVGVNSEVVIDGESGFVVRDERSWKSALLELLRDPVKRQRFGAVGRAHVARNYSAESLTPRIAEKLHELARGRSAST